MPLRLILVCVLTAILANAAEPTHPKLPFKLADLKLVDEVTFDGDPGHELSQLPKDAVSYKNILGRKAMVLKNKAGASMRYAAVRLGKGVVVELFVFLCRAPEQIDLFAAEQRRHQDVALLVILRQLGFCQDHVGVLLTGHGNFAFRRAPRPRFRCSLSDGSSLGFQIQFKTRSRERGGHSIRFME